ncbi:deacylase [Oceanobacillus oncorhynchi subsp. incaldanensis]|uniref:succinylglutamate desuccinylase/aspartoacylase family protein n=1 Tax=Oceanobacillus oncorhynchi TaxID=545501 RepID=UPI001B16DE95|nr:succinylglutamate desuccinylase/aspartoacylase family protein [Oceanobacillus oncorhynchi]GIO18066.1 deacylase [Oceanobacillus oncorhynchi subsp. incaldanensis]
MSIKYDKNNLFVRGEKINYSYSLGKRHDGTEMIMPLISAAGMKDGPVVGIVTGVHGDEYEGPEALRRFIDNLDLSSLKGTVIATPHANVFALESINRTGWIDYLDMNRSYPGREDGYLTERASNIIVEEIVEQSDYLIDLHSAGLAFDLEPFVGFNNTDDEPGRESFELATKFGIPLIYQSAPFPKMLTLEGHKRKIPSILVEAGGEGRCKEEAVKIMIQGLENILNHLGMIEKKVNQTVKEFSLIKAPSTGAFVHSPSSGILQSKVKVGDEVSKGERLGEIVDVFGKHMAEVKAPVDGIVLIARTIPSVSLGDWTYEVVEVLKKWS